MSPSAVRIAVIIALAHAVNDAYASIVPPLLPRIMDDLDISIALAATLGAAFSIATALPQPFFGYLGDRYGAQGARGGRHARERGLRLRHRVRANLLVLLVLLVLGDSEARPSTRPARRMPSG